MYMYKPIKAKYILLREEVQCQIDNPCPRSELGRLHVGIGTWPYCTNVGRVVMNQNR